MKSLIRNIDIIALQNLEHCGAATVNKICGYLIDNDITISTPKDLLSIILELRANKVINSKFDGFELSNADEAYAKAERILLLNERHGIKTISVFDDDFPASLRDTIDERGKLDVPILLYYKGDISATKLPSVSIIGTREPTDIGVQAGRFFGKFFAEKGYNIVSGLAIGCDTAGHVGALETKGITTAFLAHGLDSIYPPQNIELAEDILSYGGVLFSEYSIGTPVSKYTLVARDRLQAGLAMATIVIQTGEHGGTMHAANTTILAKKPLFVVQYKDMTIPQVQGNLLLNKKGAEFITSSDVNLVLERLSKPEPEIEVFKDTLF